MLLSPSHNVSWRKVRQKANELDLVFSPSKDYKELVMRRLDVLQQLPHQEETNKSTQFINKTFGSELGDLQIKKRFTQNQNRTLNSLKRKLTDQVLFRNQILDALAEPIIVHDHAEPIETTPQDNVVVAVLSDWHLGATVDLSDNQYNIKIAENRINTYYKKLVNAIHDKQPKQVILVNLGDLIEGAQMRKNQAYSIELSLGQQIRKACELQGSFVRSLAIAYPDVKFSFTELEGNHDRFAPNKKDELPQDGISIVARTMMEMLSNDIENLEVIEPDNEYRYLTKVMGHNLMFVHGDRDKLADKGVLGKLSVLNSTPIDTLIGGHLHSIQIREQGNDKFVCQAGSLIGPSDYSDSLGVTSSPSQLILTVNKDEVNPQIVLL